MSSVKTARSNLEFGTVHGRVHMLRKTNEAELLPRASEKKWKALAGHLCSQLADGDELKAEG